MVYLNLTRIILKNISKQITKDVWQNLIHEIDN